MSRLAAPFVIVSTLLGLAGANAAERAVDISADTFGQRCVAMGGQFGQAAGITSCDAGDVLVECQGSSSWLSQCAWPGVESRTVVVRLIGMPAAEALVSGEGSSGPELDDGEPFDPNQDCNPCEVL